MTLTLLLDLDDTLLETNMGAFVPAYFQALSQHLAEQVPPERMLPALMKGTELMLASDDPAHTLQQVFEAYFYPSLGIPKEQLAGRIEQFYDDIFPSIGAVTKKRPGAVELVNWALAKGHRLVVATDPLFPRKAIDHRIRWAGLDPGRFELISSFEAFHFTKPRPVYFAEVLGRLGWPSGPVLMAGNDVERDLEPAQALGLLTYQVSSDSAPRAGAFQTAPGGTLPDLRSWLESAEPGPLGPAVQTPAAILAVMLSTPAVLQGLTASVSASGWPHQPDPDQWALVEIICHLRDTEREIHHMQLSTLLEQREPFIPRPDSSVWAKERNYLGEDGLAALQDFTSARLQTLGRLAGLSEAVWKQEARHAIFGPTHFQEVIGFMADHDRLHIQQAWNLLRAL